jgi:hypothetical protein
MSFYRYVAVVLMFFASCGLSEGFAQTRVAKPKVTLQPLAASVDFGHSVEFSVGFNSTVPATCQWRRNKVSIPDATGSSYVITTVFPEDAGKYDVVITNSAGATTSKSATLTVNLAPASLPLDAVIYGDFQLTAFGETVQSVGSFLVTGTNTLQDPEAPSDTYTFTYTRLPKNKAKLVIYGSSYDSELGGYITSVENYTATFTGITADGVVHATATGRGSFSPPPGYRPSKVGFSARGTVDIEGLDLGNYVPSSGGSSLGGTLTLGGGSGISAPIVTSPPSNLILNDGAPISIIVAPSSN